MQLLVLLHTLQCCTFDFNDPLTHLLNSHLMSPESVVRGAGFQVCRARKQHSYSKPES